METIPNGGSIGMKTTKKKSNESYRTSNDVNLISKN